MGPSLLKEVAVSTSLLHFLSSVIALEDRAVSLRVKHTRAGDLDHILMLFMPSEELSVVPADIQGIYRLLQVMVLNASQVYVCIHACTYASLCLYMYVCVYLLCMYLYVCSYVCINLCIYVYRCSCLYDL